MCKYNMSDKTTQREYSTESRPPKAESAENLTMDTNISNAKIELSPALSKSSSSTSIHASDSIPPSEISNMREHRPKRSSSLNVDYNLKKRRVITSFDEKNEKKRLKYSSPLNEKENGEEDVQQEPIFVRDSNGDIIGMNDTSNDETKNINDTASDDSKKKPHIRNDFISQATGLPLNHGPTERIKKESLWNYKKSNNPNSPGLLVTVSGHSNEVTSDLENHLYKNSLKTHASDNITQPSTIRYTIVKNKNADSNDNRDQDIQKDQITTGAINTHHIKIKSNELKKSKLFNQNILDSTKIEPTSSESSLEPLALKTQNNKIEEEDEESENEIENDDFCSSCLQTGSFLCCDTCPRSFHFLCLDPPVDPDNLPEGDWSCKNCLFKHEFQTNTQIIKGEKEYLKSMESKNNSKLFGKLLFQSKSYNPRQFNLPQSIKDSFNDVKTGERGEYSTSDEKQPLTMKQLFNTPYGQSVSKLDSYCPENHYVNENAEPNSNGDYEFLFCYRCRTTKFGTWEHPEDSRVIIKCDYCNTPWHLDCVPDLPRASLKNLGQKWKCPLHTNSISERRLNKRQQKFFEPSQSCNFKNNGDIEIEVEQITSDSSKLVSENFKKCAIGDDTVPIPLIKENSVKIDFLNKIYLFKQSEKLNEFRSQEKLIEKLVKNMNHSTLDDVSSLLYFRLGCDGKNEHLKRMWDFKELCNVAKEELGTSKEAENGDNPELSAQEELLSNSSAEEIKHLLALKRLIESKPKSEVIQFFGLDK